MVQCVHKKKNLTVVIFIIFPILFVLEIPITQSTLQEEESTPAGSKKGLKGLEEEDEADKKKQKDAGYVEVGADGYY